MTAISPRSLTGRWDALFDTDLDARPGMVVRFLLGPIVVWHLLIVWGDRYYRDRFHVPFFDLLPHPPETVYRTMLVIGMVAGVAMMIRPISRWATVTAFVVVTYNLLVDQLDAFHNRAFLVLLLFCLSLLGPLRTTTRGATWPLSLMRFLVSTVYLTSGGTKILNSAWRNGLVLRERVLRYDRITGLPFPDPMIDVLSSSWFHRILSPATLATELFIGIGLWWPRTRTAAVVVAVVFHVSIQFTAAVQIFSYAAIAALPVWWTPGTWPKPGTFHRIRGTRSRILFR